MAKSVKKKYIELIKNENTVYHSMWDTATAELTEKIIGLEMRKYLKPTI